MLFRSVTQKLNLMNGDIEELSADLELKIGKNDNDQIVSMINASADEISLTSNRFSWISDYSSMSKNGMLKCFSGNFGGWNINDEGLSNEKGAFIHNNGASTIYTVADLIIIREYLMGNESFSLSETMIKHYDFDGDGIIGATDYVQLQNLIGIRM